MDSFYLQVCKNNARIVTCKLGHRSNKYVYIIIYSETIGRQSSPWPTKRAPTTSNGFNSFVQAEAQPNGSKWPYAGPHVYYAPNKTWMYT